MPLKIIKYIWQPLASVFSFVVVVGVAVEEVAVVVLFNHIPISSNLFKKDKDTAAANRRERLK